MDRNSGKHKLIIMLTVLGTALVFVLVGCILLLEKTGTV